MQRTRSTHSIHRPLSRASTQSAHSPAPDMLHQQQYMNHHNPETMLLHYAQGSAPHMDAQMMQRTFQSQHIPMDQFTAQAQQFATQDGSYMFQPAEYAVPMGLAAFPQLTGHEPEDRRRKGSSATATNDKELRELLAKNEARSLPEVAQEVIAKERTPQAEKTKQLFAMLWLRKVCKAAKTSVPRNRVYSHYATRCGTERVVPLNPASFGKLVRVIFPGIQTRRLGVRGESKYHYVDLCLVDDSSDSQLSLQRSNSTSLHAEASDMRRSASTNPHLDFNQAPRLPADAAAFPSQGLDGASDGSAESQPSPQVEPRGPPSTARLFAYPDTRGMVADNDCSIMYDQNLRFPAKEEAPFQENDTIVLPNILPFCPVKTDPDTAEALTALYRTHCTSLIDCIRFCKEKQFFRLFTSFHGTLTVPVQKLLAHPNLAPWIQACDTLMYQKMVRFVSRLTLQAAPPVVINILNNISTNLHAHISKTFASHPTHVLQAKLKPAATFASLLHRLIRVNAAAHAAANLLTVDQNREQMWREWVTMVNPKRVMEAELPACGYEEVYKIMTCDIRGLLEPLSSPPFPDNPLFAHDNQAYGFAQANFPTFQQPPPQSTDQSGQVSTENVLDRWSVFLTSLPSRFPQANTRLLLHCISAVGTAALRDITIMGGASYQTWWVMKIFVDEMALWLAAMGGFLEHNPVHATPAASAAQVSPDVKPLDSNASMRSGSDSRMSSMEVDFKMQPQSRPASAQMTRALSTQSMHTYNASFDMGGQSMQSSQPQQLSSQPQQKFAMPHPRQSVPSQPMQNQSLDATDLDDSGIGMGLVDDDLAMSKYGLMSGDMSVNIL
ncbi:hypothetical protein KCU61_g1880, partial [Aureobasidium melanogenum]